MAILNHLISSLRSPKKKKKEKREETSHKSLKQKPLQNLDNLSSKEKALLEKLNSIQSSQDFKTQLSKINSLTTLEKIRPFIIEHKDPNYKEDQWIDNTYNQLLLQKIVKSTQVNEEIFETLEKMNQEDKIIKVFLEKDFGPLREKALEKLKSKESLIKLAKKINSPKWGQKLIEQISDPEILLDLTSSASHKKVRLFAKEKRDSLFKQTYGQSNLTNIHSSQNLKLIGEKI